MFNDPALVLTCDLPIGWCLDAESSLFRIVFRPWDGQDERVILTVLPAAATPTTSDDDWAIAATGLPSPGNKVERLTIAGSTALNATLVMTTGETFRRIVVRGPGLDLIADHVQKAGMSEGISPVLLRIVSSARIPARPPFLDPDAGSLEEARAAIDALSENADAESIIPALRRLEGAAEEKWIRSLLQGNFNLLDLDALETLLFARLNLGHVRAYLLTLCRAHAVLMRAVPSKPPTQPYIPTDDHLRPALADRCEGMFSGVARVLRRHLNIEQYKNIPDDIFVSDVFLQTRIGTLIIEDVRSIFEQGQRASPAAAYEGLLAQLYSRAMLGNSDTDRNDQVADGLMLLGRAVTAYVEAAQQEDDRDSVVEAAEYLTSIGRKLLNAAANVNSNENAGLYLSQGATYAVTGLANNASALIKTADQASLDQALSLVEEAHGLLQRAPQAYVDMVNIRHLEALAALQLGDVARAREAALQGKTTAGQINDQYQIRFFDWILTTVDAVGGDSGIVRSVPELQYARAAAEEGADAALRGLCAALERELADDPTSSSTVERLVLAARILDGHGSEEILAAVDSLLDLKRLLVSSQRELQRGSDDSLLARRVAEEIVSRKVASGELKAAVTGADRARARSLLLDLTLPPGHAMHLRETIEQGYNPGVSRLLDGILRERTQGLYRLPPIWDGPLGSVHSMAWLRGLSKDLQNWVTALTEPLGVSPLTADEIIGTTREHRQPILVLHPTEERLALFLIKPDGEVHHAWSPSTIKEIFDQAQQVSAELGVWVSARQVGKRDWSAASGQSLTAYRAATASLYQSLFKPLQEHLAGYNDLTIIPYRELSSLPFALLEDETGAALLDRFSISIAPSIASLHVLKHRAPSLAIPPFAFVIGNPATPDSEPLPGAAIEAGIVRDRLATAHPTLSILFRTDYDATPTDYIKSAPGAKIVHLACHASVGMTASASALCLAPGPNEDSMLDFAEISGVPLNNALVFLAACRSGAGRATADGTVGLAREFLRAGARAVVASYWKVSDEATRILVDHFYNYFLGGADSRNGGREKADVATALRKAMSATRDDLSRQTKAKQGTLSHPSDWGPFFVLGDGSLRDDL